MKVRTTTRRGALLLVAMMVALLTLSGVALAAFLPGTNGPDRIGGTNRADTIRGYGGNDILDGNNGPDRITGGPGDDNIADGTVHEQSTDRIWGSSGNDNIYVQNNPAHKDYVNCGSGKDFVRYDFKDVLRNCPR